MAVTLQLARVSPDFLASCRRAAAVSPDADPGWDPLSADVLDLDWAPPMLLRAARLGGPDAAHRRALQRALEGDDAIDLAFLDTPPHDIAPFGGAPTALSADQVARVAELLEEIDFPALLTAAAPDEVTASALTGDGADTFTGDLRTYLLHHADALREFYREASRRRLLVVLWWD